MSAAEGIRARKPNGVHDVATPKKGDAASEGPESQAQSAPKGPVGSPRTAMPMFGHMFKRKPTMADLRRRTLTLIDVVAEQHQNGPLVVRRFFYAMVFAALYSYRLLPVMFSFGVNRWQRQVDAGLITPRPGGFYAEVSWAYALTLSVGYTGLVLAGVRLMERCPPVRKYVFEGMAVYNCVQCLLNLYCCCAIILEVRRLGFHAWGNPLIAGPQSHTLGSLIWLQYHARQLQLLETFFMVLRKKFQAISLLHLYMHVLNLWGWYFACRFACSGDTYFPAATTAACNMLVYLYYSLSLLGIRNVPLFKKALITEVQICHFVICAVHNVFVTYRGHLPVALSLLHLFVILNGLVLFSDFHSQEDSVKRGDSGLEGTPLTFSFDSSGWLFCYHFGVAVYLRDHILPGINTENAGSKDYPDIAFSGSSGGSLVACVLSSGADVREVFEHVLKQHGKCRKNPLLMFPVVEEALRKFNYEGAHKNICRRLRVLVTRISLKWPFVMGEVIDDFPDSEMAVQALVASCHVPLASGILPKRVGSHFYYDGLAWSGPFVPWRASSGSRVVKVSARAAPLHDVQAPYLPLWWAILPPSVDCLRGLFWQGYRDMARWCSEQPHPFMDMCGCRKLPGAGEIRGDAALGAWGAAAAETARTGKDGAPQDEAATAVDDALAKWRACRTLHRKAPAERGKELPERDPVTGQDVQHLVAQFQTAADRGNRLVFGTIAIIAPLAVLLTCLTMQL